MKCRAKNRECEFAEDLQTIDQNTGEERYFTMCYAGYKGKPCPYHWYNPELNNEDELKTN